MPVNFADVCIISPQRFGRQMFRVDHCQRVTNELFLEAGNVGPMRARDERMG